MISSLSIFMSLVLLCRTEDILAGNGQKSDAIQLLNQNVDPLLSVTAQNKIMVPQDHKVLSAETDTSLLQPELSVKISAPGKKQGEQNLHNIPFTQQNEANDKNSDFALLQKLAEVLDQQNSHGILFRAGKEYQPNKIDETKFIKIKLENSGTKNSLLEQPSVLVSDGGSIVGQKSIQGSEKSDQPLQIQGIEQKVQSVTEKVAVEGPQNFNLRKYIEYSVCGIIFFILVFMWVKREKEGQKKCEANETNTDSPCNLQNSQLLGDDSDQ